MNDPIDDKALDEHLAGGSAVSRRYRELGADAVPPELDRRVLEHARAAVERPSRMQAWRRWSVPVALAASVVLAVAILLDTGVRQQKGVLSSEAPAPAGVAPAPPESERKSEIARAASGADNLQHAVPPVPAREAVAQIAPAAQAPAFAAPPSQVVEEVIMSANRAADTAPAAASPIAPEPQLDLQARVHPQASAAPAAAPPVADVSESREREASRENGLAEVVVTSQYRARAPAGGAGPRSTIPRRNSPDPEAQAVGRSSEPASTSPAVTQAAATEAPVPEDPARWLETIRQLRKDGKVLAADQEWEKFRAAFPHYAVAETDAARPRR